MPLVCMWGVDRHLEGAPPMFAFMWAVAGICFAATCGVSCTRLVHIIGRARQKMKDDGDMLLPAHTVSALGIVATPPMFSLFAGLSLIMVKASYLLQVMQASILFWAIRAYFSWILNALGSAEETSDLINALPEKRWWCSPPLCCCGFIRSCTAHRLGRTDLQLASTFVAIYGMETQFRTLLVCCLEYVQIDVEQTSDGFCHNAPLKTPLMAWSKYVHVLASMTCVTSLATVRKVVAGALDSATDEEHAYNSEFKKLNLNRKFLSVSLIVLLTGLVNPIVGALAQGMHSPVAPGTSPIHNCAGCPMYDREIMSVSIQQTMTAVFMLFVSILSSWAYRPDEETRLADVRQMSLRQLNSPLTTA